MKISNVLKQARRVSGVAVAVLASQCAVAAPGLQPGLYVGGGLAETKFEIDGVSGDANPSALFARVGYQVNDYLAAEARLGTGLNSDTYHHIKTDIEEFYGIYAKVGVPTTVGLYPYAVLGLTQGELKASSVKQDDTDLSVGVGVDYWFDRSVSVGLEYTKYVETNDFTLSALSLGFNVKF